MKKQIEFNVGDKVRLIDPLVKDEGKHFVIKTILVHGYMGIEWVNKHASKREREEIRHQRELMHCSETVEVWIDRVLVNTAYKPYFLAVSSALGTLKDPRRFSTLTALKKHYGIKQTTVSGTGWAVTKRGQTVRWTRYKTIISTEFVNLS